jgi:hypothetical protein
MDYLLGSA